MKILVVEDEELFAQAVRKQLSRAGHDCVIAGTLADARRHLGSAEAAIELVLLDERLPDGSGLAMLAGGPGGEALAALPVIVMTAFGDIDHAVSAMKLGARDYIQKPLDLDELSRSVARVGASPARRPTHAPKPESDDDAQRPILVGESAVMAAVRERIGDLAGIAGVDDAVPLPTVLILGETGTGKDLAARLLHASGARHDAPFVHIDCASLPKELIEDELFGHERGAFTGARDRRDGLVKSADGGTIFLDEIAELPLELQTKLLSLIERKRLRPIGANRELSVRARFIAATNRDLQAMVAEGSFRADLYYRLNVLTLTLPALRQRLSDIPRLAEHFAAQTTAAFGRSHGGLTAEALAQLASHDWPGNCRELKHTVERIVLLNKGAPITAAEVVRALPDPVSALPQIGPADPGESVGLDQAEQQLIEATLRKTGGNVSKAARLLGTTRMRLRYRMDKHGIDARRDQS